MKQSDLNRAVARATGESVATIRQFGFLLAEPGDIFDPEPDDLAPQLIDWDQVEADRYLRRQEGAICEPALD